MGTSNKLLEAFRLFDEANAQDPNKETFEGKAYAKELLYAQRMTDTLAKFEPNAPEALQLTARCQHICRWEIPRETYEMDRAGYLKWRQDLKTFHAQKASMLLQKAGYDQETIDRVIFLLLKKQLKKDRDTQTLEDVICLVFLEYYYEPFLAKHDDDKMISILQKTWHKMSPKGHEAALALSFSERGSALISKALSN